MRDRLVHSLNRSSEVEIAAHLLRADTTFTPALSSRVNIQAYAQKLHDQSVLFEKWQGDELVGLVAIYCNQPEGGAAFVTSVSVLPEFQRRGIAGQLMSRCIEHVRSLGFSQIELEVDQRSSQAVALYQGFGFNTLLSEGSTLTMSMTLEMEVK